MDIVIFTQRVEVIESYNERRDCADQRIAEFIAECGYLPVPFPNNAALAEELLCRLKPKGIILTGGNSLVKYGGNAPERDEAERKLLDLAIADYIPVYGFCRGMQMILDYFGNALINVDGHVAVRHPLTGNSSNHEVNSYHNQGCVEVSGSEIKVVATAEDGVIEEIYCMSYPIAATMWHPEREDIFSEEDIDRVKKLFERNYV